MSYKFRWNTTNEGFMSLLLSGLDVTEQSFLIMHKIEKRHDLNLHDIHLIL